MGKAVSHSSQGLSEKTTSANSPVLSQGLSQIWHLNLQLPVSEFCDVGEPR